MRDMDYLPIAKAPIGWKPSNVVHGTLQEHMLPQDFIGSTVHNLAVLGSPISAPPELSPEARAVLEAAAHYSKTGDSGTLCHAARSYAATLTPPDPITEARKALADICVATSNMELPSLADINRLSAALDRMKKDAAA